MRYLMLLWIGLLLMKTTPVFTQGLSKSEARELSQEIIKVIDEHYIIPQLRDKIVSGLKSNLDKGKYDQIATKSAFEKTLTDDLLEWSEDKHLYLVYDGKGGRPGSGSRRQMRRQMSGANAFENLLTYKMLDGYIAYLNVPRFAPLEYLKSDIDGYLEMSLSADALIIDVRQCPGGVGETMTYLAGGFIAEPTHLTSYYSKDGPSKSFSAKTTYGASNQHKDVYVLVSGRSGSAAEGFAFYLQQLGRVKVVGMQSAGAGRSNQFFSLSHDFKLSVSTRISITPNGKQFQGVGVRPDIITPSENALNQARIEALLKLAAENPHQQSKYDRLISDIGKPEVKPKKGDRAKIKETVLGYIENFFENKADEMYKYLHPELAKRGVSKKRGEGTLFFQNMTQAELSEMLQNKKPLSKERQQNTVEILDVFYNTASVKLKTGYPKMQWIEYILLTRIKDEWKIVDILWDYYPKTKSVKTKK